MSEGKLSMVVMGTPVGPVLCLSGKNGTEPAVYTDSPPAELRCAELRTKYPHCDFKVMDFYPL